MTVIIEELKKIRDYFLEHDKTIFEHHAYNFLNDLIDKESVPAETLVRQGAPQPVQTAGQLAHNLEWYIPEDYGIVEEPSILNVFDEENNIIDNELFMLTTLRKK